MRDTFIRTTGALLDDDPRTAVVIADISAAQFAAVARAHRTGSSTSASASS